jgi:hypothetical protein
MYPNGGLHRWVGWLRDRLEEKLGKGGTFLRWQRARAAIRLSA